MNRKTVPIGSRVRTRVTAARVVGTVKGRRVGKKIGGRGESGVTVLAVWTVNGRWYTGCSNMLKYVIFKNHTCTGCNINQVYGFLNFFVCVNVDNINLNYFLFVILLVVIIVVVVNELLYYKPGASF